MEASVDDAVVLFVRQEPSRTWIRQKPTTWLSALIRDG